jgi:hypothetical protein
MSTNGKMQIFYGVENPASIKTPNQSGKVPTNNISAPDVAHSPQQTPQQSSVQPITQIVKTLQSVKTDTPEAKLNKDSMTDSKGKRITFNDELTGSQTFKGVEDPSRLPIKKK